MTKHEALQRVIRQYREETGKTDVEMKEVAEYGVARGFLKLPVPRNPYDILKDRLSEAARIEMRYDKMTKMPYRANLAYKYDDKGQMTVRWFDQDDPRATRSNAKKSATMRREGVVSDMWQLTLDFDHWNRTHPDEDPIIIKTDLTEDIEERRNAPQEMPMAANF